VLQRVYSTFHLYRLNFQSLIAKYGAQKSEEQCMLIEANLFQCKKVNSISANVAINCSGRCGHMTQLSFNNLEVFLKKKRKCHMIYYNIVNCKAVRVIYIALQI